EGHAVARARAGADKVEVLQGGVPRRRAQEAELGDLAAEAKDGAAVHVVQAAPLGRRARRFLDDVLLKVGHEHEQNGQLEEAYEFYKLTDQSPSRERRIRILDKGSNQEEAIALAQNILEQPKNASEAIFAKDFLSRSGIRINRSMHAKLKDARTITIPKTTKRVEKEVAHYFEEEDWNVAHAENAIWRAVFGLLFWEELFNTEIGTFHHPLQRQPSDLLEEDFYMNRKDYLAQKLDGIKSKKRLTKLLNETFQSKSGIANRFIIWHPSILELCVCLVERVPLQGLKNVLLEMAKNIKENSTGFPDLFMWKENTYRFYEIKSPNDHLSAQQLFWLDFLSKNKIRAEILRVRYE
ncbi:MAG: VRR-NUC domain-containing protein, partial [Bacteroidota bacterium]